MATMPTKLKFLALLTGAGLLVTGCSSGVAPTAEPTKTVPTTATGPLTVWVGSWWEDQLPIIQDAWKAAYPDSELTIEALPNNGYNDKFTSAVLGGSPPDVVDIDTGTLLATVAAKGLIQNLDGYFDDVNVKDYPASAWKSVHYDGSLYGIPNRVDSQVYYYNKTVFDNAGVAYPTDDWTQDDLLKIAKELTIPGEQWGLGIAADPVVTGDVWATFLPMLWSKGGDILNADNTKAEINSAKSVAGIQYWADFYLKYHVTPEGTPNFNNARDLQPLFQANKLGLMTAGSNLYQGFNDTTGLRWGTVLSPLGSNYSGSHTFVVPVGARNTDSAVAFIRWFTQTENEAKFMNRTPALYSAQDLPPWNDPGYDIFKKAAPDSGSLPAVAGWSGMATDIATQLQRVLVGDATAQEAADAAAERINEVIAQNSGK
jgi:multiple sugar transport system substrate-binding protein